MRTIKFRGKRKDNEEWVYGFFMLHPFKGDPKLCAVIVEDQRPYEVIPETVGQFTNRVDEKSVVIWDGSIIEYERHDDMGRRYRGTVRWSDDNCRWYIDQWVGKPNHSGHYTVRLKNAEKPEVIGNIHENAELLD